MDQGVTGKFPVTPWSYTTGYAADSGQAVAGGTVYISSGDGKVYALDAT